ncbi:phosphatase 2C-like domain-containing protein [Pisolithus croceorrhizus]|nr:phosphatase 2C-like domain-containing protein [Pisolithus croceorrhizus]KAI6169278.1 phosphatase 2C-like domain-containing protein [Pisolithus thermaeus]
MEYNVVRLDAATPSEHFQALEEVKEFHTTDLGRGGKDRWTYRLLPESALDIELQRRSVPHSTSFVDSVTFQPCTAHTCQNQDRYSIEEWDLRGGIWRFSAIYDGHCGLDTVDFVHGQLPAMIRTSLQALLNKSQSSAPAPELVSETISRSIRHLDNSIRADLFDLLPCNRLESMSDFELHCLMKQQSRRWATISARCTQGSTIILALSDPPKRNLWVANLGDSQAVLVQEGAGWAGTILNSIHNCDNPVELQRILREHPEERECIWDKRVIGYLAPTRAVGDTWLKVPSTYTRRAFGKHNSNWISPTLVADYARRILSPPYVSNVPDTYHLTLDNDRETYLILCSDGLLDLYGSSGEQSSAQVLANKWAKIIGRSIGHSKKATGNLAFHLLRDAIGGSDVSLVSQNLTLEMDEKWMDDVTILVQRLIG